jgi:hypothetical protein
MTTRICGISFEADAKKTHAVLSIVCHVCSSQKSEDEFMSQRNPAARTRRGWKPQPLLNSWTPTPSLELNNASYEVLEFSSNAC